MIDEVDESLRTMIRRDALDGTSEVDVVLDAPTKDWAARRNAPTVNVYLYEIRELVDKRQSGTVDVYGEDGRVVARRPMPRRFALSYLVTAWTQRPEDEHRLLSSVLQCFLRNDIVPADDLVGSLARDGADLRVKIASGKPERSTTELWSALGGELKPSLDLVIEAPLATGVETPAGPPVREVPRITVGAPELEPEPVPTRRRRRGKAEEPPPPPFPRPQPWRVEDTVAGGAEEAPGRRVTIRTIEPS